MNRTLLVSLLKKNIDELILLTDGFEKMSEYPAAIILLAKNKTDDIKAYIDQLGDIQNIEPVTAAIIPVTPELIAHATPTLSEVVTNESDEKEGLTLVNSVIEDIEDEPTDVWKNTEFWQESIIPSKVHEVEKKGSALVVEIDDHEEVVKDEAIDEKDLDETLHATYIPEVINKPSFSDNINIEKKMTIAEKMAAQTLTRNEFHAKKDTNAINDSIAYKKVEDIRQAISLGDRFRFQRELFHNNGEEMNKMLSYINMLASYDEIVSFLQSKYGWSSDHPAATDFYQLIKRKF